MNDVEDESPTNFENWRIRRELHTEIGVTSKSKRIPMYQLAELAWRAYKSKGPVNDSGASDPAITPQNEHEYSLVSAILALVRERKNDPPIRGKRKGAA